MKVCVFGAGAIGGHLAARFAAGGAEVSVVARGAQLDAIRAKGLRVHGHGTDLQVQVAASDDPATLGRQDAVVVTVKAPALPQVAQTIAPLLERDTPVAFVMNGIPWWYFARLGTEAEGTRLPALDPDDALWRAVGPDRAVGGVIWSACTVTEPGVVELGGARNRVAFGEPDGSLSPRVQALAEAAQAGGMTGETTERIRDLVWSKLLLNLGSGPACVLTGTGAAALMREPALERLVGAVCEEVVAIGTAWGCTVQNNLDAHLALLRRTEHTPSIVQDLQRGRPMEVEAMFAIPLELARMKQVQTPVLDLLVGLAKVRARAAGLYP